MKKLIENLKIHKNLRKLPLWKNIILQLELVRNFFMLFFLTETSFSGFSKVLGKAYKSLLGILRKVK